MRVLSVGGSNSKQSINRKLANYTAGLFESAELSYFDLSAQNIPLFSVDLEPEIGLPEPVQQFADMIDACDLIVLSLAENNSSLNAGFKNLLDWTSRIKGRKTFGNKAMLLMATSPGARGGASVLQHAAAIFPFSGAAILATFSLPSFQQNFNEEKGIVNEEIKAQLLSIVKEVTERMINV